MERSFTTPEAPSPRPQESPEQKAARLEAKTLAYFERFFEEAFEGFVMDHFYELPQDREIRQQFEDDETSPIGEAVHWLTVTDGCVQAFTRFCRKQSLVEPHLLRRFTDAIHEAWGRWSPNILSEVSLKALPSIALLQKEPAVSEDLRESMLREAVYRIRFSRSHGKDLVEDLLSLPTSNQEVLACLAILPTLGRIAELEDWNEEAGRGIQDSLERWKDQPNRSILLKQAAESALASIHGAPEPSPYPVPSVLLVDPEGETLASGPRQIARDTGAALDAWGVPDQSFPLPKEQRHTSTAIIEAIHAVHRAEQATTSFSTLHYFHLLAHIGTLRPLLTTIQHPEGIEPLLDIAQEVQRLQQKTAITYKDEQRFERLTQQFETSLKHVLWGWPGHRIPPQYLGQIVKTAQQEAAIPTEYVMPLGAQLPGKTDQKIESLSLLRTIHSPLIYRDLERRFGFPLVELSLREQLRLAEWLIHTNEAQGAKTIDIIRTYGVHAAQTFLACEQGAKHGEQILAFAQTAPKEVASRVFAKFADIANLVDTSAQDLASQFLRSPNKDTSIDVESVRRELIKRGARILTEAHTLIQQDPSGDSLLARLERYKADTVLFLSLCTTTLKQHHGQLQLEQLRDIEVSTQSMHELSVDDRRDMAELLEQQWSKKPLEHLFPETGSYSFFLLRRHGRVIGFLRFEQLSPDAYHANFLCVDESLRGSGLGEQLFTEVMDRAAKTGPVHAEFDPVIPAGSMYIERFGFIGTGTLREDRPDGIAEWITLERNNALSGRLTSRDISITPERLQEWALSGHAPKPLRVILLTGDTSTMEAQMLRAIHSAKQQNSAYLLSRYLRKALPSGQEERLLVFDIPQEQVRKRSKYASSVPQSLAQAYTP